MPEEEIKRELKELAENGLNRDFIESLANFDKYYSDYLDKEPDFNDDVANLVDREDAFEMAESVARVAAIAVQKDHGPSIASQLQSFFDGPEDASDEKVSQWVRDNYRVVRLLACSRMPEASKKIESSSPLFALCSFAEKVPAAVAMAKNFMLKYHKEAVADGDKQPQLDEWDYQNLMQKNLKDLKHQHANLDETDKRSLDNTRTFLAESGGFYSDNREKFDKFAEDLENAKTYRNSKEYELLIKWVKHFNESESFIAKGDTYQGTRTDLQNYSMKLFGIKGLIKNYLNHKAKDGVKKNAYGKLAAVEALNSFVSQELEKYKPDYNERENAHRTGKEIVNCTYTVWQEKFDKVPEETAMPDKQRSTLNCMGRIIARAEKLQLPKEKIQDLKTMRTAFARAGAQKAPEEKAKPRTL